jgi:hypothetical protein
MADKLPIEFHPDALGKLERRLRAFCSLLWSLPLTSEFG